jgi:hypothetical protein|tara:strand:+ start:1928 stop:3403 length:1476 start_codon:yes stop_codon:yes gene_type:complete
MNSYRNEQESQLTQFERNNGLKLKTLMLVSALAIASSASASNSAGTDLHETINTGPDSHHSSRISDVPGGKLKTEGYPSRPKPIIEWGPNYLGNGVITRGYELPGGAVWQPRLMVYGTYRGALQSFHQNNETASEWANGLDLFANLQLSGSERFVLGIQPLQEDGRFSSYQFESGEAGWTGESDLGVTTFFFEGDFGEIFPNLDTGDKKRYDLGFTIGRQSLNYQAGMLINDRMDIFGVTRNTLAPTNWADLQVSFVFGWNDIHRGDNHEGEDNKLFALLFALDRNAATNNLDFVYVQDREDTDGKDSGFFWGISDVRRIGHYNLSTRLLGSHALDDESTAVGNGNLLFAELSWTPAWTHDNVYVNGFISVDDFTSAARDPAAGGALGQTGILFQAVGLGTYGAALGSEANSSVGGVIGYQLFIDPYLNQFIFELGVRKKAISGGGTSVAGGVRYRHRIGQHSVVQVDFFTAVYESSTTDHGGRLEWLYQF